MILQDLNHQEREITRLLTDQHGRASLPDLTAGLYRLIATCPYSRWRNAVQEFLVRDTPITIALTMSAAGGYDNLPISIGQLTVHVLSPSGAPAIGARVLVRDVDADPHSEHWGITNAQGTVSLDLTVQPAVILVVYRDQLYDFPTSGLETERTLRLK